MKVAAVLVCLAALAYFGWNLAVDRGWIGSASEITGKLGVKKNENFAKP